MRNLPSSLLIVVDRELAEVPFVLRRTFSRALDREFARWLASPERGRFLTITAPPPNGVDALWNWERLEDVIEYVAERYIAGARHLHVYATAEVMRTFSQLADAINAIRDEARTRH